MHHLRRKHYTMNSGMDAPSQTVTMHHGQRSMRTIRHGVFTEREFIKQRQKEGIAAAKARGVKFGRAPLEKPAEFDRLQSLWLQGEVSAREAGRQLNVTHKTFLRWVQQENFG